MKKLAGCIVLLGLVCLVNGFIEFRYFYDNNIQNNSVKEIAVSDSNSDNPLDRIIDFSALRAINEDIKAWIYIPKTNIDYPILVGNNDEEYIDKDINGEYNPLGSLFSYSGTNFTKGNSFIFGHNISSGQMFGSLKKYLIEDNYLEDNRYFYIYTERKIFKCYIYSIFICKYTDSFFYNQYDVDTADYASFLSKSLDKNYYANNTLVTSVNDYSDMQMFSLVTCYGRQGTSDRLVINGLSVEEKMY